MTSPVIIIAEVGVNHNGDFDLAKQLIDVAAKAGVDIVKFQTFKAQTLVTRSAEKAEYQKKTTGQQVSQFEMLRHLELTREMHRKLVEHCAACNVEFLSTGFDIESVSFLVTLGQTRFKIPSGEITNLPYLRYVGRLNKSIFLSTGMATMDEIKAAIDTLEHSGTPRNKIMVMHCTTEYPTPMVEVNLHAMQSIRSAFGVSVGYSDHTIGIEVPIAAVALGACVIEKHFTLDRRFPGPDHRTSIEPDGLITMVAAIRNIENALGSQVKGPTLSESKNKVAVRKSIVASRTIKAGEVFNEQNVSTKRPALGLSPMRWDDVIGSIAFRNFDVDELIEL